MIFQNRTQAGEKLAQELKALHLPDPIVLAIPRGGVPVGVAVAKALSCPFDVVSLIKIPIPWSPEASYGVVVIDGTMALNQPLIHRLELSEKELEMAADMVMKEVKRRELIYRNGRLFPSLQRRAVILTDDGLASGYSMLAAAAFVRKKNPGSVIIASPVASESALNMLSKEPSIDKLVALVKDAEPVFSLPSFYKDFAPLTDDDVVQYLSGVSR